MESDAEALLNRIGLRIDEFDLGIEGDPDLIGLATVEWLDLGHERYEARLLVRPGISAASRAGFARWALDLVPRWAEHGPELDGWQRRESDAGWQLWCREVFLPSPD